MKATKIPLIFIVEDDLFYANALKKELENNKLTNVVMFHNGDEPLAAMDQGPQIVLLDHQLGDMNGLQVLHKMKQMNPDITVIFLSAQEKLDVAIKALKLGAYDYIEKNEAAFRRVRETILKIIRLQQLESQNVRYGKMYRIAVPLIILYLAGMIWLVYETFGKDS